ncbi:Two component, sigma54 specific, transcriptional regulator, Fis family [uncultured delta proteobacterium]|uniref:Two component, sigma54 specific, transcriptional regulator, Fis family n=1 Tax=uncultured delta proteobacterium TaxID=34034 RepID=A0A212JKW9_9DELT|nr:Two component, sigma54 specific, transcriptional regulator, Fis family [uncultured delta proteobacterium]
MRIMVVDDNDQSLQSLSLVLGDLGHDVRAFSDPLEAFEVATHAFYPLIITDIRMPGMDGLAMLTRLKENELAKDSDIVLITGHGDMQTAIDALRRGAYDYLNKPINARELAVVVDRCAEHQALRLENLELKTRMDEKVAEATRDVVKSLEDVKVRLRQVTGIGEIVADSPAMRRLVEEALIIHANPSVPVLIEGETGTGKEVIAKLVHHGETVSPEPFIAINCAAIPHELFESELFGHEPGAFTGSRAGGAPGKLEAAGSGTVFLDEVAELPLTLQPKLLRVLEERTFYRLGGVKKRTFSARVICAANRDLSGMVEKGLFRRDLYHRLRVGHLRIIPLRERGDDLVTLAEMVLARETERKKKRFRGISAEAMHLLRTYSWPGNVREMENTLERAVLMHDGEYLLPEHLHFVSAEEEFRPAAGVAPAADVDWISFGSNGWLQLPDAPFSLDSLTDTIVRQALSRFDGNKSKAASFLGVSRYALLRRINSKE